MVKKASNIKIIKNEEKPETPEILAAAIIQISDAMKKLSEVGGLTTVALIALIRNMPNCSYLSKEDIKLVLENLPKLSSYYIRSISK